MKNKILAVLSILLLLPLAVHAESNIDLSDAMNSLHALKFTPTHAKFSLKGDQAATMRTIKNITPGTVTIQVSVTIQGPNAALNPPNVLDMLMKKGAPQADPNALTQKGMESIGSGFIVGKDNEGRQLIITNAHVVDMIGRNGKSSVDVDEDKSADVDVVSSTITVRTADGSLYSASLLGFSDKNHGYDLALLRFNTPCTSCKILTLADAKTQNAVAPGEFVIAVGAPFGLYNTVTSGIVSNADRVMNENAALNNDYIQTDAAINEGNSGGPLIDVLSGKIIGVNAMIFSPDDGHGSVGIGFAIPIKFVQEMLARYKTTNVFDSADPGLTIKETVMGDMLITAINDDFKSQGLQIGDIISSVDGKTFKSAMDLIRYLANKVPGSQANFNVSRQTESINVTVTLKTLG